MTNILLLPQFTNTSFSIAQNSDWLDTLLFTAPGSPTTSTVVTGASITSASATVTGLLAATVATLIPGQGVTGFGIPANTVIGTIASATSITLALTAGGTPVNATVTNPEAELTFAPIPLDITGISFLSIVRISASDPQAWITASTAAGTMTNGGTNGVLAYAVPAATIALVPPGNYVTDIVATGDGHKVNLFQKGGPASVTIIQGVSR